MNINQKYIDLHLLCCSGYGNVDYAYDDCKIIQKAIQDGFGVTLSIAECYNFWHWRSEQYDASFLSVGDTEGHVSDIQEWFVGWLKETDYTASCELFGEVEKPVEQDIGERGEELKAFVNALTPEQMQETMEKFRAFMPQRIINYNEIGRKLVEVQPMPDGAIPYFLEHTFGKKSDLVCKDCYYCDKRNKKTESYCAKTDREDDTLIDLDSSPAWCPRKNIAWNILKS